MIEVHPLGLLEEFFKILRREGIPCTYGSVAGYGGQNMIHAMLQKRGLALLLS